MTDAEKAALKYLDWLAAEFGGGLVENHVRTLQRLLAEPRLPAEPSKAILEAIQSGIFQAFAFNTGVPCTTQAHNVYRALYAHLTAPKTKTVEVWRVESAYHGHTRIWQANDGSKSNADQMAAYLATDGHTCIHVTGPHKQEVPA